MTAGLDTRRVILSGATSGLGLAAARRLIEEGARVWVLGSRPDSVEAALAELDGAAGGTACDAADEPGVERAVAEAAAAMGGIDAAFVNAGIDGEAKGVLELSADHFRRVLDVNVVGAFLLARAVARDMAKGGAIVINASVNGVRAEAGFADYNASKAAAVSLAQTMALELGERGIAVTCICPGYVRTRMTAPYLDDPETARELLTHIPARRFGRPEEVGALVAFLISPEAAYLTGSIITIDGGRSV
ncbi:MAG TPA: SDR family NAD(P)-dependent oxidoreductase [Baekduia sp.]|nr:SDR family NAD(P)-dependent oxidoreductase [Baekduia sp.]